jgi:ring-1,2-phenylacetyl-CoA epoxidase subunit PaaC
MQNALEDFWTYTGELFVTDEGDEALAAAGVAPAPANLKPNWDALVQGVLADATLKAPAGSYVHKGGKRGVHTEHLGHILAEMQFLQRAYPGAAW